MQLLFHMDLFFPFTCMYSFLLTFKVQKKKKSKFKVQNSHIQNFKLRVEDFSRELFILSFLFFFISAELYILELHEICRPNMLLNMHFFWQSSRLHFALLMTYLVVFIGVLLVTNFGLTFKFLTFLVVLFIYFFLYLFFLLCCCSFS